MSSLVRLFGNTIKNQNLNVNKVDPVKYDQDMLNHPGFFEYKDKQMHKCELKSIPLSFYTFFRNSDVESTYKRVSRGTNIFATENTAELVLYTSCFMLILVFLISGFANFGGISIFSHICREHVLTWSPSFALLTYIVSLFLISLLFVMIACFAGKYLVARPIGDHVGTLFSILVVTAVIVELMTANTQYLSCIHNQKDVINTIDSTNVNLRAAVDLSYLLIYEGTDIYNMPWIYNTNGEEKDLVSYTTSLAYQIISEDNTGKLIDEQNPLNNILEAPQGICHETMNSNGSQSFELYQGGTYTRHYNPLSHNEWRRKQVNHCSKSGSSKVGLYLLVNNEAEGTVAYMLGCLQSDSVEKSIPTIYIPFSSPDFPEVVIGCILPQRGPLSFSTDDLPSIIDGQYDNLLSHLVYLPKIYLTVSMFIIAFTTYRLFSSTSQVSLVVVIVIGTLCVIIYRIYLVMIGHEVLVMVLYILITWLLITLSLDAWRSFQHRIYFYNTKLYKIRVNSFDPSSYMRERNFAQLSVFEVILQRLKFCVFLMYAIKPTLESYNDIKQITGQFCSGCAIAHKLASSLPSFVRMRLWGGSSGYILTRTIDQEVPEEVPTPHLSERWVPHLGSNVTMSMGLIDVKGRIPDVCLFLVRRHLDPIIFVNIGSTWKKLTDLFWSIDASLLGHHMYLGTHTASSVNAAMSIVGTLNGTTALARDDHLVAFIIAMAGHEMGIHRYDWQTSVDGSLSGQLYMNNVQSNTAIARILLMLRRPEYNIFEGFDLSHIVQMKRIIYHSIICTSNDALLSYQNINLLSIYIKQGVNRDVYGNPTDHSNVYLMLGLAAKFGCLHYWWLPDMNFLYWKAKQEKNWDSEVMLWRDRHMQGDIVQEERIITFFDNHVVPLYHCVMLHRHLCRDSDDTFDEIHKAYRRRKAYIRYLRIISNQTEEGKRNLLPKTDNELVERALNYYKLRNATIDSDAYADPHMEAIQFINTLYQPQNNKQDIVVDLSASALVEIEKVFDFIYMKKHNVDTMPKLTWRDSKRRGRYCVIIDTHNSGFSSELSNEFGIILPNCQYDLVVEDIEYEKREDDKFIDLVHFAIISDISLYSTIPTDKDATNGHDKNFQFKEINTEGYTDVYQKYLNLIARERMELLAGITPLERMTYLNNVSKKTLEEYLEGNIDIHELLRRYCRRYRHNYRTNKRFRHGIENPVNLGYMSDSDSQDFIRQSKRDMTHMIHAIEKEVGGGYRGGTTPRPQDKSPMPLSRSPSNTPRPDNSPSTPLSPRTQDRLQK